MIEIILRFKEEYSWIAINVVSHKGIVIREITKAEFNDIDDALNAFRFGYALISHFQKGDA